MHIRILACTLVLTAASDDLLAQDPNKKDSATRLEDITVTATRSPAPILTTPLAITKITAPELRTMTGYGLSEALSLVPGVIARSRYGTSDIQLMIRGFGARGAGDRSNTGSSRGVRVLIDGFPETEPDGRTAMDQVDLNAASSIEVVRSNASSMWGNAAGGVVNVISVPSVVNSTFNVGSTFGSFGLRRYTAQAAAPLGNGTVYGTFTNTSFAGWRAHSSARRTLLNLGMVGTIGEDTDVGIYVVATNNLMFQPGPLTEGQLNTDPTQANAGYVTRNERRFNRTGRIGITVDHRMDSTLTLSSTLYVNPKYQQRSERNSFRDFTRYHLGGSAMGRKVFMTGTVQSHLTLGFDEAYQDGAILFYNLTPAGERGKTLKDDKAEGLNNFGIFAQDELAFTERLTLLVGARYDQVTYGFKSFLPSPPIASDTRHFSRISPKLGASWLIDPSHSVYANVGGGLEVPAANESDPTPGAPASLLNPLQKPILSTSYELGVKSSGTQLGQSGITASYSLALYDIEVKNDAIPYNAGRYYLTAGRGHRNGLEVGVNANTTAGVFGNAAVTLSRNRYLEYVVDSAVIFPTDPTKVGALADYSGNQTVGIPASTVNLEVGTEIPGLRAIRLSGTVEYSGRYFADDANAVTVPSSTVFGLKAALRQPILSANGWGLRGFVTVDNLTDKRYVGASFLNPDLVDGAPAAYQPGLPRTLTVSLTVGKL